MQSDFTLITDENKPLVAVEVSAAPNANKQWAAQLRRNLYVHGALTEAPYFLLVLPEHIYLWKDLWKKTNKESDLLPDFEVDTKVVLKRYLSKWINSAHTRKISESNLQMAVWSWLTDLTTFGAAENESAENKWLFDSGLARHMKRTLVLQAEKP